MNLHFAYRLYWCILYDVIISSSYLPNLIFVMETHCVHCEIENSSFMFHLDEFLASESESY